MFHESKYIPPEEYSLDLGDSGHRLERDKGKQIVVSQGTVRPAGPSVWGRGGERRAEANRECGRTRQRWLGNLLSSLRD